ncbi:hypothetical protein QQZ08_005427 [Neonectria magnoliae]|uniref:Apple domain-containing protein n=1 Tax=Neonectria magnoliae TaxID=2732573 RepID=A0ABR1I580_9HYPO
MAITKIFVLLSSLAMMGINASPCFGDSTTATSSTTAPTSICLKPDSKYGVEGEFNSDDGIDWNGLMEGTDSAFECSELCGDRRRPSGWCIAFEYFSTEAKCHLYGSPVKDFFTPKAGTDVYFYDQVCWECPSTE